MREARAGGPRARRASPLAMVGSYSWPVSGSRGQVVGRPSSSSCTGSEGGPEVALRPGPAVGSDRPEAPAPLSQRPSNRRSGAWPAFGPSSARLRPVTYRETTGNEQRITQPFPLPADVHFRRSAQRFGANTPQEDDGERIYRFDDHRLDPAESPRPDANRRVGSSPCELPPDHRATATPPVVPIASVWLSLRRMPDAFASYAQTRWYEGPTLVLARFTAGLGERGRGRGRPDDPCQPPTICGSEVQRRAITSSVRACQRFEVANRTPKPIMTTPAVRSSRRCTRGRVRMAPSRLPISTRVASHSMPSRMKIGPSSADVAPTGAPGGTNTGRKLMKKTPWG